MNKRRTKNKSEGGKKLRTPIYNLVNPNGRPVGILGIKSIIDERKRAEKALRESEEKFRLTFENAKDAILWADPRTGLITNCNKAAEILLEKKRGEIVGHRQTMIHPPQKAEYYTNMFKKHIKKKRAVDEEAEVITKSGKIKTVHITASVTLVGGKPIIQGIFRDITERKRVEETLWESEGRFRDIAENAMEWIWEVDAKGKYTFASPIVKKILGYEPEEVLIKHFYDLFHPEDREKLKKAAFEVFAKKQPFREFINRNVHKSGKTVWLSTSGVPILDEKGNLLGYRGADIDITERKQAENRIKMEREVYRSIARAANRSRSVKELCELALKGIRTAIKYDMADVLIYRESENALLSIAKVGYPEDLCQRTIKRQDLKGEPRVAGQAVRKRKSIYIDDITTNKLTSYAHDLIVKYNISTLYVVPLFNRGKLQGVLEVLTLRGKRLSKEDREVLDTVSEELAGGIAKARIEEQLITVKEAFGWLAQR